MMGFKEDQKELFSYSVDRDKRVRPDNPLRRQCLQQRRAERLPGADRASARATAGGNDQA